MLTPLSIPLSSGTDFNSGDIDYYVQLDPVHFNTDNRPLKNLAFRDNEISSAVNTVISHLNTSAGTTSSLGTRLNVSVNPDGTIKTSAIPDITALQSEIVDARDGESSLDDRLDLMQADIDGGISKDDQFHSLFEQIAQTVRESTNSGAMERGLNNLVDENLVLSLGSNKSLSRQNAIADANSYLIGNDSVNGKAPSFIVNGYRVYPSGEVGLKVNLGTPPVTGARQDLIALEVWLEEVDKDNGLFFPYGNTGWDNGNPVDGTTILVNPTFTLGSAYFVASSGVYAVNPTNATAEFLKNPKHNIGVLDNGNYFQVRFRLVNFNDIKTESFTDAVGDYLEDASSVKIIPQGQLGARPSVANNDNFVFQNRKLNAGTSTLKDAQIILGGNNTNTSSPVVASSNAISQDGFVYLSVLQLVHRRNSGIFGFENLNGSALVDTYHMEVDATTTLGTVVVGNTFTNSSSTFRVLALGESTSANHKWMKAVRVAGINPPTVSSALTITNGANATQTLDITAVSVDAGQGIINDEAGSEFARPDMLSADQVDRRDIFDLRPQAHINGVDDVALEKAYNETVKALLTAQYRENYQELQDFDNDGNGTGLLRSKIYGNVLMNSWGVGATIPDSATKIGVTKVATSSNGASAGFDSVRSKYSDAGFNDQLITFVEDQADGTSSKTHSGEFNVTSYNAITHALESDLSILASNNTAPALALQPIFDGSFVPTVIWGSGHHIAGVLVQSSTINWSFEIEEFGGVKILPTPTVTIAEGDVYRDSNTNDWVVTSNGNILGGNDLYLVPLYTGHDGSVVIPASGTVNKQSGAGGSPASIVYTGGAYLGQSDLTGNPAVQLGFSNSAHGVDANESITEILSMIYPRGYSFMKNIPFKNTDQSSPMLGAEIAIDGAFFDVPQNVRPGVYNTHTKEVDTSSLLSRTPALLEGVILATNVRSPTVIRDGATYHMWFTALKNGADSIHYATSTDGYRFSSVVGIETDQSVLASTGVGTDFDETGVSNPVVIKDGATFKMWYIGTDGLGANRLGYATSADGISWSRVAGAETKNAVLDDVDSVSVLKDVTTYKAWYIRSGNVRFADSGDGIAWANHVQPITNGNIESLSVIKESIFFKMFYTLNTGGNISFEYAVSGNGEDAWTDVGRFAEDEDVAGSPLLSSGISVIKDDKGTRFLFTALDGGVARIFSGTIAMVDYLNTGSSLTGVYATASNVGLGYRSTDALVYFYESVANRDMSNTRVGTPTKTLDVIDSVGNLFTALGTGYASTVKPSRGRDVVANYIVGHNNEMNVAVGDGGFLSGNALALDGSMDGDIDALSGLFNKTKNGLGDIKAVITKETSQLSRSVNSKALVQVSPSNEGRSLGTLTGAIADLLHDDALDIIPIVSTDGGVTGVLFLLVKRADGLIQLLQCSGEAKPFDSERLSGINELSLINLIGNPVSN